MYKHKDGLVKQPTQPLNPVFWNYIVCFYNQT